MNHIALYRKCRPQSFRDIVGQEHITRTLQNSLAEGRLSHAYLFNGPRGTGKTTAAKVLAKAVNCERGPAPEPCNECDSCLRISSGSIVDVQEIDAASNRGIEEIRDLRDKVKYAPTEVRRKVYIIDEVHMLTTEAFNALLKTLEEPPEHVMFILATTEPHKLLPTIISRCQRFDFRRVALEEQVARMRRVSDSEGFRVDEAALRYIARLSDGGMRDALSLLDQAVSYSADGFVTLDNVVRMTGGVASDRLAELARAVKQQDAAAVLALIENWMAEGKNADKCLEHCLAFYRDLLMFSMLPSDSPAAEKLSPESLQPLAGLYSREELFGILDVLNQYLNEMKYAGHPRTILEIALLKLCGGGLGTSTAAAGNSASDGHVGVDVAALVARIAKLEERIAVLSQAGGQTGGGAGVAAPTQTRSTPSPAAPRKIDLAKLQLFAQSKDRAEIKQLIGKWSAVLQQVKERQVTVHAWLIDSEPVSIHEGAVLLAFKNTIHRETTERPANKQLIEQVIGEVLGSPVRLVTVMLKDWNQLTSGAPAAPPPLELEPGDSSEGSTVEPGGYKEPWIREAIQMFGEELVVIKDDDK